MESPATKSYCEEIIFRLSDLGCEDEPHRHKFCKYYGKVGTTASTVVWVVDKEEISLGDEIIFINYDDIHCDIRDFYVRYLSRFNGTVRTGVVDRISTDGYIFIKIG